MAAGWLVKRKRERTSMYVVGALPVQPDPASYSTAVLVEWLNRAAMGQRERLAAIALLYGPSGWLHRSDWRAECLTVVPDGEQSLAFIEWDRWDTALGDWSAGHGEGLHHGTSGRRMFEMARWMWNDPFQLTGLDAFASRRLLRSLAVLTGHPWEISPAEGSALLAD